QHLARAHTAELCETSSRLKMLTISDERLEFLERNPQAFEAGYRILHVVDPPSPSGSRAMTEGDTFGASRLSRAAAFLTPASPGFGHSSAPCATAFTGRSEQVARLMHDQLDAFERPGRSR